MMSEDEPVLGREMRLEQIVADYLEGKLEAGRTEDRQALLGTTPGIRRRADGILFHAGLGEMA